MIQVIHAPSAGPLTQTVNADGFSLAGGTTPRTLSVISADVVLNQSLRTTDSPTFVGVTVTGGTVTVSTPLINATQTWNAAGVTFTGLRVNVTNTASAAASRPLAIQVNSTDVMKVGLAGEILGYGTYTFNVSLFNSAALALGGITSATGKMIGIGSNVGNSLAGIVMSSDSQIFWTSVAQGSGVNAANPSNADLFLARDAAGILAQRNGTNAQTKRLYNTYISASVYERLSIGWASNICTIKTEHTGAVLRGLNIGGAGTDLLGFYGTLPTIRPTGVAVDAIGIHAALVTLGLITA